MALARKIKKDVFDKLDKIIQAEYTASGDEYILDVTGLEDFDAMRRAKERETQRAADLTAQVQTLTSENETLKATRTEKDRDIDKIEKGWKDKLDKATRDSTAIIGKQKEFIERSLRDGLADKIATKISTMPRLMSKELRERIVVDFEGDEPVTKILGKDGKPSDMTVEQLEKEFLQNGEFKAILIGSHATGGRADTGVNRNGRASPLPGETAHNSEKPLDLTKISAKEHLAMIRARKEAGSDNGT